MGQVIKYFNKSKQKVEEEKIYGGDAVRFFYENPIGSVLESLVSNKFISKIYGAMQSSGLSSRKIPDFLDKFEIEAELYEKGSITEKSFENSFKSFNEFFIRKFKAGKRSFKKDLKVLPAFCEARYFGYSELEDDSTFPVKGTLWSPSEVLRNDKWNEVFQGGPAMIARLCPVDYHRYHYPDNGKTIDQYSVNGPLHSVNPLALKVKPDLLKKNERRISIIETENFGKLAYVEVGATCVGKIVQSFDENKPFKRGDEKGYFLFGGSTVILFGEKGKWKVSKEIEENTSKGLEVLVELGEEVGNLII